MLLSGGVDSSVALALLKAAGHRVTAFYLKIWFQEDFDNFWSSCPWEEDIRYATQASSIYSFPPYQAQVCAHLGVPFEIVPLTDAYWDRVASKTIKDIKSGLTPNPDVLCNTAVKFGAFVEHLEANNRHFDRIASGHYALLERTGESDFYLKLSKDSIKDQTYFLARLSHVQLSKCIFPLGSSRPRPSSGTSRRIRRIGEIGSKWRGLILEEGTKRQLGFHDGYWFHTIGQRSGLKLPGGPWYVSKKDVRWNVVYVKRLDEAVEPAELDSFYCRSVNWINGEPEEGAMDCKVRHGRSLYKCWVSKRKRGWFVQLEGKDQGLASGQVVVFYFQGTCLGGGVIDAESVIGALL